MKSQIYVFELFLYFIIWGTSNLYSLYRLFEAQTEMLQNVDLEQTFDELKPGWSFLSRRQDVSDIEWSSWKYLIKMSWFYLFLQFIVSEIFRTAAMPLLKYWYIVSSMVFITLNFGFLQLIVILTQPLIFIIIILWGVNKQSVWCTSIILLVSYNSLKYKSFFWSLLDHKNLQDEEVYLLLFCIGWVELRCISFCIDYFDKRERFSRKENGFQNGVVEDITNMLSYVFYLPLLYTGPVILYEDFEKSLTLKTDGLSLRLKRFFWDSCLYLLYTALLDLAFHYMYFLVMQNNMEMIKSLPTIALCGGGLWMGVEFHMKYVISYGTTSAFARLDNIEPPPTPRCVARIHIYSHMWRYFDVGLYRFLLKYIYKPVFIMLSRVIELPKIIYKLMASFATFTFIFMWHGMTWDIFIWSILNYVGITLEYVGKAVSGTSVYRCFKERILKSENMEIRFLAILCSPLLAMSAVSNFYLFAGSDVGYLYFVNFIQPTLPSFIIMMVSVYCCCNVSMALRNVPSRTDRKKCY